MIANLKVDVNLKNYKYEEMKRLLRGKYNAVYVGVIANETTNTSNRAVWNLINKLNLVKIATAMEFGAVINHPGGTSWGFRNALEMAKGIVRFLKKGTGIELGVTPPHIIVIPARSFIRSSFVDYRSEIMQYANTILQDLLNSKISKFQFMNLMGVKLQSLIRRKMNSNIPPPNAYSTVLKKKSSKTLRDTGRLINSITWAVRDK